MFVCVCVWVRVAAADQSSQERIMALPSGTREANKGQVTPSLLQISLHTHTHTHSEREGEIDCGPVCSSHLNRGGMSMPQGTGHSDNILKPLGRQLSHLGRNLIGCVILDSFLSSQQSHCQDLQASRNVQ